MPARSPKRLTTTSVERLKPAAAGRRRDVADGAVPGLFLRVTDKGSKSWALLYRRRSDGKLRRATLGKLATFDLRAARKRAWEMIEAVENGDDPAGTKASRRAERRSALQGGTAPAGTVSWAAQRFREQHIVRRRPLTQKEMLRRLALVEAEWGPQPVAKITRAMVRTFLLDFQAARGPIAANRALALVRKFFNWCCEQDLIAASPCAGIKPLADERPRDRVLGGDEIKAIWAACDQYGYPFGSFFQMLLLLGQRRSEVAAMRRRDIIDGGTNWLIPASVHKGGREHLTPLSTFARSLIEALPKFNEGDHLFSSTNGKRPISGYSKAKSRVDALALAELRHIDPQASLAGWVLHDARRTCATWMASAGIAPHIVAACLGHVDRSVTARHYVRHAFASEKAAALEAWAAHVRALVTGKAAAGNVVALRASGGGE